MNNHLEYASPSVVKSLDEFQYVFDLQSNIPVQYRVLNKDTGQLSDLRANDPAELSFRCLNKDIQKFFDIRDGSPWPINAFEDVSASRLDLTELFDSEFDVIASENSPVMGEEKAAITTPETSFAIVEAKTVTNTGTENCKKSLVMDTDCACVTINDAGDDVYEEYISLGFDTGLFLDIQIMGFCWALIVK